MNLLKKWLLYEYIYFMYHISQYDFPYFQVNSSPLLIFLFVIIKGQNILSLIKANFNLQFGVSELFKYLPRFEAWLHAINNYIF